jgi:4-methyl-5(b-hydroxyethyl)-thiazole monophosphate biosynthesis
MWLKKKEIEIMKKVFVFLADGFEECEGLLTVDILRRAGVEVVTASVMGRKEVRSSHRVTVAADVLAEEADYESADLLVLPGGMPGTRNLAESAIVREQCIQFAKHRMLAAICAAPSILASLGLLEGKRATVHPSFEEQMAGAELTGQGVTVDGNIITGQGLGAAIPFALVLAEILTGAETADRISDAICW